MYKIGIDLGGTNIALGIVSEGEIVFKKSIPTGLPKEPDELVRDIGSFVEDCANEFGIGMKNIEKIGFGIPGSIDEKEGNLEFANNFGYVHVPIVKMLKKVFNMPVFAGNDANVAALAEYRFGAAKGAKSMAMFTLGTGLGGAYISEGKILTGVNGAAGEFGHEVIVVEGLLCSCGRRGCSEMYVSATALKESAKIAAKSSPKTLLHSRIKDRGFGAKEVIEAALEGDDTANEVFDNYLKYLSVAMANIINIFQPEVFVIGGGVSHAGEILLNPLRDRVKSQVYSRTMNVNTKIEQAVLGNDAGILGAAILGEE